MTIPANAKVFADGVLKGIGAPVNQVTETAMYNWLANEQGGPNLTAFTQDQGNPLGVMDPAGQNAGATGNVQGGIDATVANLLGGNYNTLVATFRKGKSTSAIDFQIVASPWNGAHYGGINTFLKTAGQPGGVAQPGPIPAGGSTYGAGVGAGASTAGPPGSATGATAGCSAKGNAFGEGGLLGVGSFSVTYCELKALTGAFCMAAGATIIVVGLATLIVGGLGGKGGPAGMVVAGVAPLGKAAGAVRRVGKRRSTPAPVEESEEEAA